MKSIYKKYLTTVSLIWTGSLVLLLLVNVFLLAPQRNSKKELEKELTGKKQLYESAMKMSQQETRAQLNKQMEDLRGELRNFVADSEDSVNLTFDISKIASEKNLTAFSIKSGDSRVIAAMPKCNYIAEDQIDVSFTGGFNEFAVFLNALERHQPVVFVNRFTITRSEESGSRPQINMDLSVLVKKKQSS
jgi:Tfp pilus assembly protein PilO